MELLSPADAEGTSRGLKSQSCGSFRCLKCRGLNYSSLVDLLQHVRNFHGRRPSQEQCNSRQVAAYDALCRLPADASSAPTSERGALERNSLYRYEERVVERRPENPAAVVTTTRHTERQSLSMPSGSAAGAQGGAIATSDCCSGGRRIEVDDIAYSQRSTSSRGSRGPKRSDERNVTLNDELAVSDGSNESEVIALLVPVKSGSGEISLVEYLQPQSPQRSQIDSGSPPNLLSPPDGFGSPLQQQEQPQQQLQQQRSPLASRSASATTSTALRQRLADSTTTPIDIRNDRSSSSAVIPVHRTHGTPQLLVYEPSAAIHEFFDSPDVMADIGAVNVDELLVVGGGSRNRRLRRRRGEASHGRGDDYDASDSENSEDDEHDAALDSNPAAAAGSPGARVVLRAIDDVLATSILANFEDVNSIYQGLAERSEGATQRGNGADDRRSRPRKKRFTSGGAPPIFVLLTPASALAIQHLSVGAEIRPEMLSAAEKDLASLARLPEDARLYNTGLKILSASPANMSSAWCPLLMATSLQDSLTSSRSSESCDWRSSTSGGRSSPDYNGTRSSALSAAASRNGISSHDTTRTRSSNRTWMPMNTWCSSRDDRATPASSHRSGFGAPFDASPSWATSRDQTARSSNRSEVDRESEHWYTARDDQRTSNSGSYWTARDTWRSSRDADGRRSATSDGYDAERLRPPISRHARSTRSSDRRGADRNTARNSPRDLEECSSRGTNRSAGGGTNRSGAESSSQWRTSRDYGNYGVGSSERSPTSERYAWNSSRELGTRSSGRSPMSEEDARHLSREFGTRSSGKSPMANRDGWLSSRELDARSSARSQGAECDEWQSSREADTRSSGRSQVPERDSGYSSRELGSRSSGRSQEPDSDAGHSSRELGTRSSARSPAPEYDEWQSSRELGTRSSGRSPMSDRDAGYSSRELGTRSSARSPVPERDSWQSSREANTRSSGKSPMADRDRWHSSRELGTRSSARSPAGDRDTQRSSRTTDYTRMRSGSDRRSWLSSLGNSSPDYGIRDSSGRSAVANGSLLSPEDALRGSSMRSTFGRQTELDAGSQRTANVSSAVNTRQSRRVYGSAVTARSYGERWNDNQRLEDQGSRGITPDTFDEDHPGQVIHGEDEEVEAVGCAGLDDETAPGLSRASAAAVAATAELDKAASALDAALQLRDKLAESMQLKGDSIGVLKQITSNVLHALGGMLNDGGSSAIAQQASSLPEGAGGAQAGVSVPGSISSTVQLPPSSHRAGGSAGSSGGSPIVDQTQHVSLPQSNLGTSLPTVIISDGSATGLRTQSNASRQSQAQGFLRTSGSSHRGPTENLSKSDAAGGTMQLVAAADPSRGPMSNSLIGSAVFATPGATNTFNEATRRRTGNSDNAPGGSGYAREEDERQIKRVLSLLVDSVAEWCGNSAANERFARRLHRAKEKLHAKRSLVTDDVTSFVDYLVSVGEQVMRNTFEECEVQRERRRRRMAKSPLPKRPNSGCCRRHSPLRPRHRCGSDTAATGKETNDRAARNEDDCEDDDEYEEDDEDSRSCCRSDGPSCCCCCCGNGGARSPVAITNLECRMTCCGARDGEVKNGSQSSSAAGAEASAVAQKRFTERVVVPESTSDQRRRASSRVASQPPQSHVPPYRMSSTNGREATFERVYERPNVTGEELMSTSNLAACKSESRAPPVGMSAESLVVREDDMQESRKRDGDGRSASGAAFRHLPVPTTTAGATNAASLRPSSLSRIDDNAMVTAGSSGRPRSSQESADAIGRRRAPIDGRSSVVDTAETADRGRSFHDGTDNYFRRPSEREGEELALTISTRQPRASRDVTDEQSRGPVGERGAGSRLSQRPSALSPVSERASGTPDRPERRSRGADEEPVMTAAFIKDDRQWTERISERTRRSQEDSEGITSSRLNERDEQQVPRRDHDRHSQRLSASDRQSEQRQIATASERQRPARDDDEHGSRADNVSRRDRSRQQQPQQALSSAAVEALPVPDLHRSGDAARSPSTTAFSDREDDSSNTHQKRRYAAADVDREHPTGRRSRSRRRRREAAVEAVSNVDEDSSPPMSARSTANGRNDNEMEQATPAVAGRLRSSPDARRRAVSRSPGYVDDRDLQGTKKRSRSRSRRSPRSRSRSRSRRKQPEASPKVREWYESLDRSGRGRKDKRRRNPKDTESESDGSEYDDDGDVVDDDDRKMGSYTLSSSDEREGIECGGSSGRRVAGPRRQPQKPVVRDERGRRIDSAESPRTQIADLAVIDSTGHDVSPPRRQRNYEGTLRREDASAASAAGQPLPPSPSPPPPSS